MILDELLKETESILTRITVSQLSRYHLLQCSLHVTDVSRDEGYRRLFNGYYRMQRRKADWYGYFFALLEAEKRNSALSFEQIIRRISVDRGRVEPSFSSKLVATIRPELPVYDKYVRENLRLEVPRPTERLADRVTKYVTLYSGLSTQLAELTRHPEFETLRAAFDGRFRQFAGLTDVKKLDLFLWQHRVLSRH